MDAGLDVRVLAGVDPGVLATVGGGALLARDWDWDRDWLAVALMMPTIRPATTTSTPVLISAILRAE